MNNAPVFLPWLRFVKLEKEHSLFHLLRNNTFPLGLKRNFFSLGSVEQGRLLRSKVLVVGCGGLGGYVLEILGRSGVGELIFADGDDFEETNLNRQLYSNTNNLGQNKALEAKARLSSIFPFLKLKALPYFLSEKDLEKEIKEINLVIDCIGGIEFKRTLISKCQKHKKPLITAAIAGFEGFVSSVVSYSNPPLTFYQGMQKEGAENILGSPAPAASLIATLQAAEAINFLAWQRLNLINKVLYISLKDFSFETYSLKNKPS